MTLYDRLPALALVQMEVFPGEPQRNVDAMLGWISRARAAGAELVAFSEMCIPGYLIGDLWEVDALVRDFAAWSDDIREASDGITVVFGNVLIAPGERGEDGRLRKFNAVRVCRDRRWVERPGAPPGLPAGAHAKTLHPNYRFFDDDRHFLSLRTLAAEQARSPFDWCEPFAVPRAGGGEFRFGVQLCEDLWCADYRYADGVLDTLAAYRRNGAEAVFNLSASPWTLGKNAKRNRTVGEVLARSPLPYFYCNQVGAQNNGKNVLVFDGDTSGYDETGTTRMRAPRWRECMLHTARDVEVAPLPQESEAHLDAIVAGLRHLDRLRGGGCYLVGVSGGLDSAVSTCVLERAFGSERVFAVTLPTRFNAAVTRDNARSLCATLDVELCVAPIQDLYERLREWLRATGFERVAGNYSGLVDENLQARIRGADALAGLAAKYGMVFTNNGNKTEIALGYATLYGDVNGAIAPLGDLYKTQVLALARHLNEVVYAREVVPRNLIDGTTVPSAELSAEQDVTRGLGDPIRYGYHDALLRQLIEFRRHPEQILEWWLEGTLGMHIGWDDPQAMARWFPDAAGWLADLEWVERQLRQSYFKRIQAPPIVVLSKRAFGFDLRESQLPEYRTRRYRELRARVLGSDAERPAQ